MRPMRAASSSRSKLPRITVYRLHCSFSPLLFSLFFYTRLTDKIAHTGKFRELQRLTVQYARILDLTLEDESEDDGDNHGDDDSNGGRGDDAMAIEEA